MARTYNISPKPRSLLGHQQQKWLASAAIAELVDNSFGEGRGNANSVEIIHDTAARTLVVKDEGQGMDRIGRLFQLGNTVGMKPGDIGFFGFGGTLAILWLAEWVNVSTERNKKIMKDSIRWRDVFEVDDFRDVNVSDEWVDGSLLPSGHGTVITMKLLKGRGINTSKIIRDLSQVFAPGLRKGIKITWISQKKGEDVERYSLTDPYTDTQESAAVEFNISLEGSLTANGRVVFCADTSHADSVIRIGFGHREIMKTRECYSNKSATESYSGIGVSGWVDLGHGWQPKLTTTKNDISDEDIKADLMEAIFFKIKDILSIAEESSLDIELDLIASNLQLALNRLSGSSVNTIIRASKDDDGEIDIKATADVPDLSGTPSGVPGNGLLKKRKTKISLGGRKDLETDISGATFVRLVKQTDEQMNGFLCRAESGPTGILIDINKDHLFVQEALRQKPVNQMALNLMIAFEVATILVENPQLAAKILRKDVLARIEDHDGSDRVRMLERAILDSISVKSRNKVGRPPKTELSERKVVDRE